MAIPPVAHGCWGSYLYHGTTATRPSQRRKRLRTPRQRPRSLTKVAIGVKVVRSIPPTWQQGCIPQVQTVGGIGRRGQRAIETLLRREGGLGPRAGSVWGITHANRRARSLQKASRYQKRGGVQPWEMHRGAVLRVSKRPIGVSGSQVGV